MTTEKEIRKVKLDRSGNLQITYDEIIHHDNGPVVNKVTLSDGHKVHQDLKNAFTHLISHMVLICEQTDIEPEEIGQNPDPVFPESDIHERFKVTGFSMAGGDSDGVVLIGNRKTNVGVLNLVSPFVKYEDSAYRYIESLTEAVNNAIAEVHEYLNGKYAPEAQLSLAEEFES